MATEFLIVCRYGEVEQAQLTLNVLNSKARQDLILFANEQGNTCLHYAAANGHHEMLQILLNYLPFEVSVDIGNVEGNSPLHWACLNKHLETCRVLINRNARVGLRNKLGKSCVSLCIEGDDEGLVKFILCKLIIITTQLTPKL